MNKTCGKQTILALLYNDSKSIANISNMYIYVCMCVSIYIYLI